MMKWWNTYCENRRLDRLYRQIYVQKFVFNDDPRAELPNYVYIAKRERNFEFDSPGFAHYIGMCLRAPVEDCGESLYVQPLDTYFVKAKLGWYNISTDVCKIEKYNRKTGEWELFTDFEA